MKRLIATLCFLSAIALGGMATARADVPFPNPVGYVNDFADIIPASTETELDATLRSYDEKTTIEIVVVTVPSLNGMSIEEYTIELARAWGVGQKDIDNGVVILIAPNERQTRIEVGYGLEGVLPDATAKLIIENAMIPRFKAGDLPGGIVAGTHAVIAQLERESAAAKDNAETPHGAEDGFPVAVLLLVLGSFVTAAGLTFWGPWIVQKSWEWRKEKARLAAVRKTVAEGIRDIQRKRTALQNALEELVADETSYPQDLTVLVLKQTFPAVNRAIDDHRLTAERLLKRNPDGAASHIAKAHDALAAFDTKLASLRKERAAFREARTSYREVLKRATASLEAGEQHLAKLRAEGYRVPKHLLETAHRLLDNAERLASSPGIPDYRDVVARAKAADAQAQDVQQRWQQHIAMHRKTADSLAVFKAWYEEKLPVLLATFRSQWETLANDAPEEITKPILDDATRLQETLKTRASYLMAEVERLNSMETQHFTEAADCLETLLEIRNRAVDILNTPNRVRHEFFEAKRAAERLKNDYVRAAKQAQRAVSNPDALDAGKDDLVAADAKAREAERRMKEAKPNWLAIAALLLDAVARADQARTTAERHARQIEAQRKEEERRRRREARRDSYSSAVGRSGFGGFGGGGFGGGGASGSW